MGDIYRSSADEPSIGNTAQSVLWVRAGRTNVGSRSPQPCTMRTYQRTDWLRFANRLSFGFSARPNSASAASARGGTFFRADAVTQGSDVQLLPRIPFIAAAV